MNFFKKIIIKLLILESRLILSKYHPFIVAVTGSVGKTSTKDAIFCALKGESKYVRKSEKSFNSEIGLPLTVIGVPNAWRSMSGWLHNIMTGLGLILMKKEYPDCLVLEIGADHPGDIKGITKWFRPDISVITKVSKTPVHVEFFGSPEQVFAEKAALAGAVKGGGSLVLFADDEKVASLGVKAEERGVKVIYYGTDLSSRAGAEKQELSSVKSSNLRIEYKTDREIKYPIGVSFDLSYGGQSKPILVSNVIGETYEYPILAAAAVGIARGMSLEKVVRNLESYNAPRGRMNLLRGINDSTIIDDTYNSSPDATISALKTLRSVEVGRVGAAKIAILGDMMELGKYAAEEHRSIGREAAGIAETLITVGPRSRATAAEAEKSGLSRRKIYMYDSAADVVETGMPVISPGDVVLVKGSQSVRMERIVKALLANPETAGESLVRQEKEWLLKA